MGALLLTLITTLLALNLVTPRRRSMVDVPVDAGPGERPRRRRPGVAAVVAADGSPDVQAVLAQLLDHVDRIVVVDGAGATSAHLADFLGHPSIDVVPVPDGPGTAMARARCAGVQQAIRHAPRAVLVVEPDAAAAVELVPDFLAELAGHDAVVGDRMGPASRLSGVRRVGARLVAGLLAAALRRPVRDAACGMRLFSTEALRRVPLDTRGGASDVRHLKAMLAGGLDVVWLPVPGGGPPRRSRGALPRALTVPAAILAPVGLRAPGRSADEVLGSDLERRDLVRWGPIIAGLVTVIALLAILSALGLAVGLSAVAGDSLAQISTGAWIWGIASAVIAFFVGGLVAAMSSAVGGRERGLLNGLMVGASAVTATLLLIGFGAGALLGAGASALGEVVNVGRQINLGQEVDTVTGSLARAEDSAWGSFIGLTLAVVLAGLGGLMGARGRAVNGPARR